ncbi:hypothetical protein ACFC09_01365 [Streptomyces sp. NPDC056161]|uniref:hypothetical protein n=1 Tax=Streptomyces sp. NPDC056161 TaxID=3345732 RepID=UPI0035D68A3D
MDVDVSQHVRDTAPQLGTGVPYALKVVAGQLADDPDLGVPSELPGVYTVTVDGDLFEDCPALFIGYVRESDRVEIRYVRPARTAEPAEPAEPATDAQDHGPEQEQEQDREQDREQARPADPVVAAVTVRQVADAWRRITGWLRHNAPDSYAALRPGVGPAAIAALEGDLGIRIPVELHVLWMLTAGDDGVDGQGFLPGNKALLTLDAVAAVHRLNSDLQAHEDARNTDRPEDERITVWQPTWIPVLALGPADRTSGLYLDAATGYLGRWSRYHEGPGDELDTLVTYLEEAADMLEAPALATRDKPGLVGGRLVWLSGIDPAWKDRWRPLTD